MIYAPELTCKYRQCTRALYVTTSGGKRRCASGRPSSRSRSANALSTSGCSTSRAQTLRQRRHDPSLQPRPTRCLLLRPQSLSCMSDARWATSAPAKPPLMYRPTAYTQYIQLPRRWLPASRCSSSPQVLLCLKVREWQVRTSRGARRVGGRLNPRSRPLRSIQTVSHCM